MARRSSVRSRVADRSENPAFELASSTAAVRAAGPLLHKVRDGIVCKTDSRGHATPRGRSREEIVVDASQGFIPLWAHGVSLRWRFQEQSLLAFQDPELVERTVIALFGEALLLWGDAAPIKFVNAEDAWDFEIVMRSTDDCDDNGCVLASAFFPDAGRHELVIYPRMFRETPEEQVETLAHEIGHIFGLRHFFAKITERRWRSEIFGEHNPFSIMNYGPQSVMTENDRSDLKRLYELAWSGALTDINGTPIQLVYPFSALADLAIPLAPAARTMPSNRVAACCCCCCSCGAPLK